MTHQNALFSLPWVSASAPPEYASVSTGCYLVITTPIAGSTGRIGADLYLAHYRGNGRWFHFSPDTFGDGSEIKGVAVWLDVKPWDLDQLVACFSEIRTRPGTWEEVGGLTNLVILDIPARTPGMVVVAKADEDWQTRPELRWQSWPDRLVRSNT